MKAAMISAVLFDVGGPLAMEIAREAALAAAIREGLAHEGIDVGDATFTAAQRLAVDSFAPNFYRAVIYRYRLSGRDRSLAERLYRSVEDGAGARDFFEPRREMIDVLTALKRRGQRLGLAANQPAHTLERLRLHGFDGFFENQGVAGVYGFRKPDVRLFLRACADLGVEPCACIMAGDRVDNDIVPAKLLGMRTVLFRCGPHRDQQPRSWDEVPDREVASVHDLTAAIESLLEEA
jgi:HAD superfamily hydrolase (TIGR01549 family)